MHCRDQDVNLMGGGGGPDGTLEQRRYVVQNWRHDVAAVVNLAGRPMEWNRYTAYGQSHVAKTEPNIEMRKEAGMDLRQVMVLAVGMTCVGTGLLSSGCCRSRQSSFGAPAHVELSAGPDETSIVEFAVGAPGWPSKNDVGASALLARWLDMLPKEQTAEIYLKYDPLKSQLHVSHFHIALSSEVWAVMQTSFAEGWRSRAYYPYRSIPLHMLDEPWRPKARYAYMFETLDDPYTLIGRRCTSVPIWEPVPVTASD